MTIVWGYLPGTLFCAFITLVLFLVRRGERDSGKALLFLATPVSWSREHNPVRFKIRQALFWVPIAIFGLAGLAFLAEFLGIVQ
jgi:hypothetical protein